MFQWFLVISLLVLVNTSSVPVYKYSILNTYTHSSKDYTQGLEYISENTLIQSAGRYGSSLLQKLDFPSMSVLEEFSLDSVYFAEGITVLNNKIYQLTWKEKKMFIYSTDLVLQEIAYITEPIKEGWGMCNDGISLYISDGTSYIYKIDPSTYEIINSIRVHQDNLYIKSINELEWVDGEIWANIYYSKYIARIDPESGDVLGWIDLAGLETGEKMHWYSGYVLNGIAVYDGRIYVTGKCWENLYEIELIYYKSVSEAPKLKD